MHRDNTHTAPDQCQELLLLRLSEHATGRLVTVVHEDDVGALGLVEEATVPGNLHLHGPLARKGLTEDVAYFLELVGEASQPQDDSQGVSLSCFDRIEGNDRAHQHDQQSGSHALHF